MPEALTFDEASVKAAKLLRIDPQDARMHSRVLDGIEGYYFWHPHRGGGALIVGPDGSVLFANSTVDPAVHMRSYAAGTRTDESLFDLAPPP